jgi:hypothetical protein
MPKALMVLALAGCMTGCNLIQDIFGPHHHNTEYTVTVATTGDGSVTRNPDQSRYNAGSQVQLTAVPQPGNVFASWSGAAAGSQNPITLTVNSDISLTATFTPSLTKLTVLKTGIGSGTVTGTGIDCGVDCSEMRGPGAVVLTAVPAPGNTLASWVGCDNVSANTCTVNMTTDRTVTAEFSFSLSGPRVTAPPTSANGNYQVSVKCVSGLCSTSIVVQEAATAAFVNATQTFHANSPDPLILSYTGKAAGTYCYRAAYTVPNWGNTACVTVTTPSTAVLRISNASSYDIIDVSLNSVERVGYPYGIPAGQSADFVFTASGTVSVALGNGFYNPDQSRDVWFTLDGTATVTLGQITVVTFNNPTIGALLSFDAAENWDGLYFDGDANSFFARFRFTKNTNGWQFFTSTAPCLGGTTCTFSQKAAGTARLVSWPRYSSIVTFDFGAGTTQATIMYPFASFVYHNGPASSPDIEYVRQ